MKHYVYQIISMTPNEEGVCRIYSGLRSCECEPEDDDYMGSGIAIRGAIEKYGRDKFMKLIIAKFDTREEAHDCETAWLEKQFNFHGSDWSKFNKFHYNLRLNENDNVGGFCSPETRAKISEAMMGKLAGENNPMFGRTGVKHHNFGKQLSEETKKKLADANTGKTLSEETRRKISESNTGRIFSEETRRKIGEAQTGVKHHNFGKQLSEETKKKMSESRRGEKNPFFGRTGVNHPKFGTQLSEETKKKIGEAQTGSKCFSFKGLTIGTNSDNKVIVFSGEKSMKARGFNSGRISQVILGNSAHHKNFTFTRSTDPIILQQLLDEDNFVDEESKQIIQQFLSQ